MIIVCQEPFQHYKRLGAVRCTRIYGETELKRGDDHAPLDSEMSTNILPRSSLKSSETPKNDNDIEKETGQEVEDDFAAPDSVMSTNILHRLNSLPASL